MTSISDANGVLEACRRVLEGAPSSCLPDLPPTRLSDQPEWYDFEHSTWAMGEQIRQAFVAAPALRKRLDILEAIVACTLARNLRRGRQSFVMLLGHTAAKPFADQVATLLSDTDVQGHALAALIKMRAPGHARAVQPLLTAPHAWIRNKAKTYLERYGSVTESE